MSVGTQLRQARETAGITLADVATRTRVRASLLEAIERDDFSGCGGAVYARGHIRSFAHAVGVDPVPLVVEYDAGHESIPVPVLAEAMPGPVRGIRERSRPNWLAYGIGAAAVLTLLLAVTLVRGGAGGPSTVPPSLQAGPAHPSGAAVAPSSAPSTQPTAALPSDAVAQRAPVSVQLKITKAPGSWVQANDGLHSFASVLAPGTTKVLESQRLVTLTLGNAGAVDLIVNGKHEGAPGAAGEVVHLSFGPTGSVTAG